MAHQVYGDAQQSDLIRREVVTYIVENPERFVEFYDTIDLDDDAEEFNIFEAVEERGLNSF